METHSGGKWSPPIDVDMHINDEEIYNNEIKNIFNNP